jgi:hypothetical protein
MPAALLSIRKPHPPPSCGVLCCPVLCCGMPCRLASRPCLQRPMSEEVQLPAALLLEAPAIAGCMLAYLSAHHDLVEPLLDMFGIMGHTLSLDLHAIPAFVSSEVAPKYTLEQQRGLILAWTRRFRGFTAGLPAAAQAAPGAAAADINVFTAGRGRGSSRVWGAEGASWALSRSDLPARLLPRVDQQEGVSCWCVVCVVLC